MLFSAFRKCQFVLTIELSWKTFHGNTVETSCFVVIPYGVFHMESNRVCGCVLRRKVITVPVLHISIKIKYLTLNLLHWFHVYLPSAVQCTGVLRLLDYVCGICCQSTYGCVTVSDSLNVCRKTHLFCVWDRGAL